ncbi:MAG: hypothetical protein ACXU7H_12380, partial [Burkholderiaceae bacterium]
MDGIHHSCGALSEKSIETSAYQAGKSPCFQRLSSTHSRHALTWHSPCDMSIERNQTCSPSNLNFLTYFLGDLHAIHFDHQR